jgi:hypothetical protein
VIDWHGPRRQPCSQCDRGPSDRALSVTLDERGGVALCHRCGYVETMAGEARNRPVAARSTPRRHETLSDLGCALWRSCGPIDGAALAYLESRHCVIPPADGDLRWHPALRHPSGHVGPALVALVTHAQTRAPLTLHRTWVRRDGAKAPVSPPRMLLGGHRKVGGVVRLWPDDAVSTGLAIAEGIETALALAHAMTPVWSVIDAGNLAAFPVLYGIEVLTIAADHDDAGIKAAEQCAARWVAAGREVRVVMPEQRGRDVADVAMEATA